MNFDLKLGKAASVLFLALVMAGCGGGGSTTAPEPDPDPAIAERAAIDMAIGEAEDAVALVNNDSDTATVSAADAAITAARMAIARATNVPADERAANTDTVDAIADNLTRAKTNRLAAMDDAERRAQEEAEAAAMEMMATARKLYAGISLPGGTGADTRTAAYGTGDNANDIAVTIGDAAAVNLSEDEDEMVAALHGWEGKKYTLTPPGEAGTYEAVVYSNVEEPTEGRKFGGLDGRHHVATREYEYDLDAAGMVTVDGTAATNAPRVGGSSFDHTAGVKVFKLPSPNPNAETIVTIPGSFHGVSGTYSCTPGAGNTCAAQKAAEGYTLGPEGEFRQHVHRKRHGLDVQAHQRRSQGHERAGRQL